MIHRARIDNKRAPYGQTIAYRPVNKTLTGGISFDARSPTGGHNTGLWPSDEAPENERLVALWTPMTRTLIEGQHWALQAPQNGDAVALLGRTASPGVGHWDVVTMKRGPESYSLQNGTEFYVFRLAPPPREAPTIDAAEQLLPLITKALPVGGNVAIPVNPGGLFTFVDVMTGMMEHGYRALNSPLWAARHTVGVTICASHRYPSTAVVIATQIDSADGSSKIWLNGNLWMRTPSSGSTRPPPVSTNNVETALWGCGDPKPSDGASLEGAQMRAGALAMHRIELYPDILMDSAVVVDHCRDLAARWGSPIGPPQRGGLTRYHAGPAGLGDTSAHIQLHATGRPAYIKDNRDDNSIVRAWFPHGDDAMRGAPRRWVLVGSGGVQFVSSVGTPPRPALFHAPPGGQWIFGCLSILGPGASGAKDERLDLQKGQWGYRMDNYMLVDVPSLATYQLGHNGPFEFVGGTAFLVLSLAAPWRDQLSFIFSKAAQRVWDSTQNVYPDYYAIDLMPHSVALIQEPTGKLTFSVWGQDEDTVANLSINVGDLIASQKRFIAVLRVDPVHRFVSFLIPGVGEVRKDSLPFAPLGNDYELCLFNTADHHGIPTFYFPWIGGHLFELRLYEDEVLDDAAVNKIIGELSADYGII